MDAFNRVWHVRWSVWVDITLAGKVVSPALHSVLKLNAHFSVKFMTHTIESDCILKCMRVSWEGHAQASEWGQTVSRGRGFSACRTRDMAPINTGAPGRPDCYNVAYMGVVSIDRMIRTQSENNVNFLFPFHLNRFPRSQTFYKLILVLFNGNYFSLMFYNFI